MTDTDVRFSKAVAHPRKLSTELADDVTAKTLLWSKAQKNRLSLGGAGYWRKRRWTSSTPRGSVIGCSRLRSDTSIWLYGEGFVSRRWLAKEGRGLQQHGPGTTKNRRRHRGAAHRPREPGRRLVLSRGPSAPG